jgi:hypothetical protein
MQGDHMNSAKIICAAIVLSSYIALSGCDDSATSTAGAKSPAHRGAPEHPQGPSDPSGVPKNPDSYREKTFLPAKKTNP